MSLLYEYYAPTIYGMICRMIPYNEIAEEVLQDVFVKVWENFNKYDSSKGRLFTWLVQITRNTTIDRLRSASYSQNLLTCSIEKTDEIPVEHPPIQDSGLKRVVEGLDPMHRMLIDYVYFQGYSQAEIAVEFSMPLGTVKTRVRAAILELRKLLNSDIAVMAA